MLERLRKRLDATTSALGAAASRVIPSPTAWTLLGLLVSLFAAYAYSNSSRSFEFIAGLLLLLSGFLDLVDGAVARFLNKVTKRGSFVDSILDRVGEIFVFLGIMIGSYSTPPMATLALALSLLVSYTRAKADSLGVSLAGVGVGERSERVIVLAISSILGLTSYGVIIVIVLAAITFGERIYRVSASLR